MKKILNSDPRFIRIHQREKAALVVFSLLSLSVGTWASKCVTEWKPGVLAAHHKNQISMMEPSFNQFALNWISVLPTPTKDFTVSPLSFQFCLSMLGPGLGKMDKLKLAKAVGIAPSAFANSQLPAEIIADLSSRKILCANSLWVAPRTTILSPYKSNLASNFDAGIFNLADLHARGVAQINSWVNEHTKNRIPRLIDTLNPTTKLVLVNAIAYDGEWEYTFMKDGTTLAPFYGTKKISQVETMHRSFPVQIIQGNGFRIGKFHYRDNQCEIDILLPDKNVNPWQVLRSNFKSIVEGSAKQSNLAEVEVSFPKFESRSRTNLIDSLTGFGLGSFMHTLPDQKIVETSDQLKVGEAVQSAWIKADENGTKAAAATAITMRATAIRIRPKLVSFNMDHPFAYLLKDSKTGAILFMGAVFEPK